MKIAPIVLLLSMGCIASSEHVKKNDKALFDLTKVVQHNIHKEQGIEGFHPIDPLVDETRAIAEEPAGIAFPEGSGTIALTGFSTLAGGGGILTALLTMGGLYMRQKKYTQLAAMAAEMEPEAGKKHLEKCGIKAPA